MMKKSKIMIACVSMVVFATLLVFGGARESLAKEAMISIGGGPPSGAMGVTAGGMADFISKNARGIKAEARGTGASFDNMKLLGNKSIDTGMYSAVVAYKATKGISPFKEPIENTRLIGFIFASEYNVFVKKNSDIKSFTDLKGKKIAGGGTGTGTLQGSMTILPQVFGIDLKNIRKLGYRPASYAFKDGRVDAMAQQGPQPFPHTTEMATTEKIRFLSMTDEEQERAVSKLPYYAKNTMPAGMYLGQDYEVKNLRNEVYLAAREDTPEDIVYNVAKALYSVEGVKYMGQVHRIFKTLSREKVLEWSMQKQLIPIHPGAIKFFKELAGELGKEWKSSE